MPVTNSSNPYFDPNPQWYFSTMHLLAGIGIPINVLQHYFLIYHSPKVSRAYFLLLTYQNTILLLFQINICILSPCVVLSPYVAFEFPGIWTWVGLSPSFQIILYVNLIYQALLIILPLFYYRLHCILPPSHLLNTPLIIAIVYLLFYCCIFLLTFIVFIKAVYYRPIEESKKMFEGDFGSLYENFYEADIGAIYLKDNPWLNWYIIIMMAFGIIAIALSHGCITYTIHALKEAEGKSRANVRYHKEVLFQLVSVAGVIIFCTAVSIPGIVYLVWSHSYRADLTLIVTVTAAFAQPTGNLTYVLSNPKFRAVLVEKLCLWCQRRSQVVEVPLECVEAHSSHHKQDRDRDNSLLTPHTWTSLLTCQNMFSTYSISN